MSYPHIKWAIHFPNITYVQKLVLITIADHAHDDGRSWITYSEMAKTTGLSKKSVIRSVNNLTDRNIIAKVNRAGRDGSKLANLYIMNVDTKESHVA